jgi:hypothetical protein
MADRKSLTQRLRLMGEVGFSRQVGIAFFRNILLFQRDMPIT